MREITKRLDAEYGFNLSEEEIEIVARQAEDQERLLQKLFEVDLTDVMPAVRFDRKRANR